MSVDIWMSGRNGNFLCTHEGRRVEASESSAASADSLNSFHHFLPSETTNRLALTAVSRRGGLFLPVNEIAFTVDVSVGADLHETGRE